MTVTALERALMTAVRPMQLERRKFESSWRDVMSAGGAHNTALGPALDILMDKVDEFVPIDRWRSGNPRLGSGGDIVSDTYTEKSYFYGFEMTLGNWWEDWLRQNAIAGQNAAIFQNLNGERYNEARRLQRQIAALEREMDNDFYNGNAKVSFPGMLNLDTSKTTLTTDLTAADGSGRAEFVDTLVAVTSTAADNLTRGAQKVLVMGEGVAPWLNLPQDGTDRRGQATLDFIVGGNGRKGLVDRIVTSNNPLMAKKSFVHWVAQDNVEIFDQTPGGIVLMAEQTKMDGLRVRGFNMWTGHEHRASTVEVIDGLLP